MKKSTKILFFLFLSFTPLLSFADETITLGTASDNQQCFGRASGCVRFAQAFETSEGVGSIDYSFKVFKEGSPPGNLQIILESDLIGLPADDSLDSDTVLVASVPVNCSTAITGSFTGLSLSASTQYWVVFKPSVDGDSDNQYNACLDDSETLYDRATHNGTIWSAYTAGGEIEGSLFLVAGGGGGGGGSSATTSTTTVTVAVVDTIGRLGFYALIIFFISLIISLWIWKSFMQ